MGLPSRLREVGLWQRTQGSRGQFAFHGLNYLSLPFQGRRTHNWRATIIYPKLMRIGKTADMPEVNHPRPGPARRAFPRGQMISLKKYLDAIDDDPRAHMGSGGSTLPMGAAKRLEALIAPNARELLPVTLAAYRSALVETGKYGLDACPALGEGSETRPGGT